MKKIIAICLTTLILLSQANGNIVDQLTELNNLYKSGAINEDEFSKAKNILLKSEDDKKSNIEYELFNFSDNLIQFFSKVNLSCSCLINALKV